MTRDERTRTGRQGERGASLLLTGILIVVLLLGVSAGVDVGRLTVAARDAQTIADIAALDATWHINGDSHDTIEAAVIAAAEASAARNGRTSGVTTVLGTMTGGTFTPTSGSEIPTAVKVVVGDRVSRMFRPGVDTTTKAAVASRSGRAGYVGGSRLASIDLAHAQILNGLLDDGFNPLSPVSLTVGDYNGLATVGVAADDLADGLGYGTPGALVGAGDMGADQAMDGVAAALVANGFTTEAATVQGIADSTDGGRDVDFGDVFATDDFPDEPGAADEIDVLTLITTLAMLADPDHFVSIPNFTTGVPGVSDVTLDLHVVEAPRYAYGPVGTGFTTAQIDVEVTIELSSATLGLGVELDGEIVMQAEIGKLDTEITDIVCATPEEVDITADPALVDASLTADLTVSAFVVLALVEILEVEVSAGVSVDNPAEILHWTDSQLGTARSVGSRTVGFGDNVNVAVDNVTVLGALPGPEADIVDAVVDTLEPTLTQIDETTVGAVADALGLRFGGGTVTATAIDCDAPRLVG